MTRPLDDARLIELKRRIDMERDLQRSGLGLALDELEALIIEVRASRAAPQDRWADAIEIIEAAANAQTSSARALALKDAAHLLRSIEKRGDALTASAVPAPTTPECGFTDEGWEAFACTKPKGHEGEHAYSGRVTLRPLSADDFGAAPTDTKATKKE